MAATGSIVVLRRFSAAVIFRRNAVGLHKFLENNEPDRRITLAGHDPGHYAWNGGAIE